MKIQNINHMAVDTMHKSDVDSATQVGEKELVFKSQLTNQTKAAYTKHIEQLISDIEAQGKVLTKRADMGEMQKYREMITTLINETVSNGYVFNKESKISVSGRSKIFVTIKKVNEKLDEMTKKLLEEEKENIDFLNDVDDIRGLLVDMYF